MEVEDNSSVFDSQYELSSRRELPSTYIFFISNFNLTSPSEMGRLYKMWV